jgi:hypothetical protein
MKCVNAPNGLASSLHSNFRDYMLMRNLDAKTADNAALKSYLHASKESFLQEYPEIPLDANGEPMLFYQRESMQTAASIKDNVLELFNSNPELYKIGTPQQYSEYLDTIFPKNQILYHSTLMDFDEFDSTKSTMGSHDMGHGLYVSSEHNTEEWMDYQSRNEDEIYRRHKRLYVWEAVMKILNLENLPYIFDIRESGPIYNVIKDYTERFPKFKNTELEAIIPELYKEAKLKASKIVDIRQLSTETLSAIYNTLDDLILERYNLPKYQKPELKQTTIPFLVDTSSPLYVKNGFKERNKYTDQKTGEYKKKYTVIMEGKDSIISQAVIPNPSQHAFKLGTEKDLKQFENYVKSNRTEKDKFNITNDQTIVGENVSLWKPVFLTSYPEFLTDEEAISQNYLNLDRNSGTNGFIHLNQNNSLIGSVNPNNSISAIPKTLNIAYQRSLTNPSSIQELKVFSDFLSRKMGIKYRIVNQEQAKQLNPGYNGEPGFFVGQEAYLVSGVANTSTALHEIFGHPIIEMLEQANPDLLQSLMESIPEEMEIEIMRDYPELIAEGGLSYEGKKEALIRLMEREATGQLQGRSNSRIRNLIDNMWLFLKRVFKQYTGIDGLSRYTTIKDITDMAFNKSVFKPEFAPGNDVRYSRGSLAGTNADTTAKLINFGSNFKMVNVNGVDEYQNTAMASIIYKRLTEVINDKFSNDVYSGTAKERAEKYTTKMFKDPSAQFETSDTSLSGKIKYNGEFKSFDEIVELRVIDINTILKYGRYAHALMELYFTTDAAKITEIDNRLKAMEGDEIVNGVKISNAIDKRDFDFISNIGLTVKDQTDLTPAEQAAKNKKAVLDLLSIKLGDGDTVMSEFIIGSNSLKIGTTADLLVIEEDGAIRLLDFKTGKLSSDEHYATILMKYMRVNPMNNTSVPVVSKQNIYGMGLMLRAFIIKEGIPDARFSDLALYNISRDAGDDGLQRSPEDLPWEEYLYGIENWIKNDPEHQHLYQGFKDKGLFDFNNYSTNGFNLRTFLKSNSKADINTLQNDIVMLTGQLQMMENVGARESKKADVRELRDEKVRQFLDARRTDSLTANVWTKNEAIPSNWLTGFRNRYDFSKVPVMQMIIDYESEAVTKATKRYDRLKQEHDKLVDNVITDFERIDPTIRTKLKTGSNRFYGIDIYKGDGTGVFDFAYVPVMRDGVNQLGWITPSHPNWSKLTAPQKAYMEFINTKMREGYKTAVQDVDLLNPLNKKVNKATAIGKPELEDGFLPYVPPLPDEKKRLSNVWEDFKEKLKGIDLFSLTNTLNSIGAKPHPGMPIRFLNTSSEIKETKAHSLHVEHMFLSFMQNLYLAEELEPVLAASQGLVGYMESMGKDEQYNYIHKNTIEALSTFTEMNITGRTKAGEDVIKIGRMTKDGKEAVSVNLSKTLNGVKAFTTYGSMFINPTLAAANTVMIASLNFKTAAVNSAAVALQKTLGIDTDDIDFTLEDMVWAQKEYAKIQSAVMSGDKDALESNKIWRMMKEWRIFPDDYWFQGSTNKEYAIKRDKNMTMDRAMFLHTLGENYGVITSFAAVAHKMKVKKGTQTKSLLDAYDIVEETMPSGVKIKTLKWNFGVRGVVAPKGSAGSKNAIVTKVTELTSKEIDMFKRVVGRIHGDYRKNERSLHEAHALGQYFIQFKKYMLRQARNMFEGRRLDSALGKYEEVIDPVTKAPILLKFKDENGNDVEETYIEWSARVTEGRYTTAFLTLFSWLGHTNYALLQRIGKSLGMEVPNAELYKMENLSTDQKKNLMSVAADALFLLLGLMLKDALFDDDEQNDKNPWFIRYTRYMEDMLEGANPVDTLRGLKNPFPLTTRLYNTVTFGSEFVGSVISGDRTENGDYRGLNSLLNNLPGFNSYRTLQRFSGE